MENYFEANFFFTIWAALHSQLEKNKAIKQNKRNESFFLLWSPLSPL
jgi:hypothetical protein